MKVVRSAMPRSAASFSSAVFWSPRRRSRAPRRAPAAGSRTRAGARRSASPRHATDEHDAVAGARREVGRVVRRVDAARDGDDAGEARVALEELGGATRGRGDGLGAPEGAARGLPRHGDGLVLPRHRQQRVLEHVLRHEVVGADDADPALLGLDAEAAAGHDVRLEVHDVGLDGVEDPRAVLVDVPREGEPQPVVRVPAPAAEAVRGHLLAVVDLGPRAVLAAGRRRDDVHLVAAADEPSRKALGEARGAVHVRRERVRADEDAQRSTGGRRLARGLP